MGCGLRFPVEAESDLGTSCPLCGAPTELVDARYETHGVRSTDVPVRVEVEVLLDNVRSLSNVGSMFRTADGAGVRHMHLGGVTPTPAHPKLAKTALGAESTVPWTRHPDPMVAASALAAEGKRLWAMEGGSRAVSLFEPSLRAAIAGPTIVLVLGHEVSGVDPRILDLCERVVSLPMLGTKDSLNVSVAMGIAAYLLRFG
jgi:23S rRNA (guanosine2251-2'-O)-methyltransferase